jgi:hypothetical protein
MMDKNASLGFPIVLQVESIIDEHCIFAAFMVLPLRPTGYYTAYVFLFLIINVRKVGVLPH